MLTLLLACSVSTAQNVTLLTGQVEDADTGELLACRIYIRGENGQWYFPQSASPNGSAFVYKKQNWANKDSVEMHTTVSAHPFTAKLPQGKYEITAERGKEYFPQAKSVNVGSEPVKLVICLKRWIDMARLGWYSGDTHVHRTLEELPNVQLAEDLNVSFPLLYWVTEAFRPPGTSSKSTRQQTKAQPISIDDTHVIYPVNTEYEIFSVNGARHTLGAFFILNHKTVFQNGVPPVAPTAQIAGQEGALLELDKHNWPWSMMLVPVMNIDLFELTNNHVWRTEFAFSEFGEPAPDYMKIETDEKGFTEWGWVEYGFLNYYALLNCGFRLRPTAGTASGVHPVPLGFGRVYVKLDKGFDYDDWVCKLNEGRSFVTTGPMLFVSVNGLDPGHIFSTSAQELQDFSVSGTAESACPLQRIEIILNGQIAKVIRPENKNTQSDAYRSGVSESIASDATSWIAVRCFEARPDKRVRFAHSGPFYINVKGKPLRPRKAEINFLINRSEQQIARNKGVLPEEAVEEYRRALRIYKQIAESAK
jgi:hypothetical protein